MPEKRLKPSLRTQCGCISLLFGGGAALADVRMFATVNEPNDQVRILIVNREEQSHSDVTLELAGCPVQKLSARVCTEDNPSGAVADARPAATPGSGGLAGSRFPDISLAGHDPIVTV